VTEAQQPELIQGKHRRIPSEPSPDVFVIEGVLRDLKGEQVATKDTLAKAIGLDAEKDWEIVYRRISAAVKRLQNREHINICVVRGEGYMKEPAPATVAKQDSERKSCRRRATKNVQRLMNVKTDELDENEKYKLNASLAINMVAKKVFSHGTGQKMIAAATVKDTKRLPMADALKILQDREAAKKESG